MSTEYVYDGPQYPDPYFEPDELYQIGPFVYHVHAVADTKFGRLAWATFELPGGKIDVATLHPSMWKDVIR